MMSNYRLRKMTSRTVREEAHEAVLRSLIRSGSEVLAVAILAREFREILDHLKEDTRLGGPGCTAAKFIARRIKELNARIAALHANCADIALIERAEGMKKYWEIIGYILQWDDYFEQKSKRKPSSELNWEVFRELARGEEEDWRISSGLLVAHMTLQQFLRQWVMKGEMLGQVVSFRRVITDNTVPLG
jgi:hypothetical protein